MPLEHLHNKAFKRDSCRVAFLVCGDSCGESGVRKLGLGGIHPLTRRYSSRSISLRIKCGKIYFCHLQH
ncbi:DUF3265 domain-containing protein [Vibrio vulnificus]|nr:hypothetical protein [Vibrio vulnificus]EHU5198868.1 DUF3265 domain-containing protein [Vibrio vulnificus]EJR3610057.1 DUF3265 domain-containing protein [Vibrio vulnificus]ELV8605339.1 DUF3265 domain-containing protein [Vibrio vulnificus]ELV8661843.1 DUF3265 domain-containing protein [Vibrio vulnificus]ELV8751016.1 DUF3265 domain-containing protein [Vibrio vulnificus]